MARKKADPNPPVEPELTEQAAELGVSGTLSEPMQENTELETGEGFTETVQQAMADLDTQQETQGEDDTEGVIDELADSPDDGLVNDEASHSLSTEDAEENEYAELLRELGGDDAEPMEPDVEADDSDELSEDELLLLSDEERKAFLEPLPEPQPTPKLDAHLRSPAYNAQRSRILTIDPNDVVQTEEEREATLWHEIQNAYRTRRILTGTLDGIEPTPNGGRVLAVIYKGFRVAIPLKEMMIEIPRMPRGSTYADAEEQLQKIINSRVFSEVDFIIRGIINKSRTIAASRKDAMLKKRQIFYMDTDEFGETMVYEGRIVQARVIAVAGKVVRVEVFGVETAIRAAGLSWEWIGNASERFAVGQRIPVRILKINRPDVEHITVRADVRSVSAMTNYENLKKCVPQARYAGRVTDVRRGVIYIRLNIGVNAIAHSCYDRRSPGKNDDVSFTVTRINEEQGVAVGIITRIIKQNL